MLRRAVWTVLGVALVLAASAWLLREDAAARFEFGRDGEAQGWKAVAPTPDPEVARGRLGIAGQDSQVRLERPVDADGIRWVRVRARIRPQAEASEASYESRHHWLTVSWIASEHPPELPALSLAFSDARHDGRFHTYDVPVGAHESWRGRVDALTLDVLDDFSAPAAVDVERIAFLRHRRSVLGSLPVVLGVAASWIVVASLARRRVVAARAAVAVVAPITLLVLCEIALDAAGFEDFGSKPVRVMFDEIEAPGYDRLFRYDRDCLFINRAGAEYTRGERLNRLGLRGPLPGAGEPRGALRVAFFGDSTTFGLGLDPAATLPERVRRHLGDDRSIEAINAGVIAYTAAQGLRLYETRIADLRPDVVVLAFGVYNEHYLVPFSDPERLRIAARLPAPIYESWRVLRDRVKTFQLASRLASADTAARRELRPRLSPTELAGTLRRFVDRARHDGAVPVLVSFPRRASVERATPALLDYTAAIEEVARERDVPLIDLRRRFLQLPGHEELFLDALHLDARGTDLAARMLAAALDTAGEARGARPADTHRQTLVPRESGSSVR